MQRSHRLLALVLAAAAAGATAQPAPGGPGPTAGTTAPAPAGDTPKPPATPPAPGQTPGSTAAPTPTPTKGQGTTRSGTKKKGEKAVYKGPTEADIRVAYTEWINTINAGTTQFLDPAAAAKLTIQLAKVDIVECTPVEERQDLYLCSVLVEFGVGGSAPEFKRVEVAMVKDKDAWRVQ